MLFWGVSHFKGKIFLCFHFPIPKIWVFFLLIFDFVRFWSVCLNLAPPPFGGAGLCRYFDEFHRVPVITQLDFSRNGRLCDLRFRACVTQTTVAITEAINHLVGLRCFPLTFSSYDFSCYLPSYITVEQPFRHRKCKSRRTVRSI